jgi:hypothetical protein
MRHFAPTHRFSAFACAALAGVLFHPGLVSAVALGNLALQSSLGQPLHAVIPVALSPGEDIRNSCLKLVGDSEPGAPQLLAGRVGIERVASSTRLIVTTPRPIDEPALRVSLQAGCSNTVRRDYVLLLDPQGSRPDTMLASADIDEFKSYARAAPPAALAHNVNHAEHTERTAVATAQTAPAPLVHAAVLDIAPSKTTFTPIADTTPVAAAKAPKQAAVVQLAALTPTPAPATAPQREPVALTTVQPRSGFIAEAAAASFTRTVPDKANTPAAMLANAIPRTQPPAPEATLWTQTWPYAAIALSLLAIALTAFAKRRKFAVPTWGAPTVINDSKSSMGNGGTANTFAHFGAMSEQAPPIKRAEFAYPTVTGETTYDASLDTLLEQIEDEAIDPNVVNDNEIDEHTIRKAWATLASESAVDIGTDSILKAIAQAERELRIGPAEPKQAAIDKALDEDLLREPKLRR